MGANGNKVIRNYFMTSESSSPLSLSQEYLLQNLLQNIPDQIYFKDKQCRFIRINTTLAERFGLTRGRQEALYRGGQVLKCCLFEPP